MMVISKRSARLVALPALAFLALALLFWAGGCGEKGTEGRMKVAASIVPLADFCRNVGGDLVEVETMVPPGASPHTYEPTARQVKFMSDARAFVYNGLGLENWITGVVKKVGNKNLVEVAAAGNVPESELIEAAGHRHDEEDGCRDDNHKADREHDEDGCREEAGANDLEHGMYDPHVWLDPNLAICQVQAIRDGFVKADPENAEVYKGNAREYVGELKELDEYVKGETSTFALKDFVSFHPAFAYFAHRYGLKQVGVIEELPGKEPSAGEIAKLLDVIREQGVQVIFTEPQFNPQAAEAIAAEAGARVVVKAVDPLGNPDDPEVGTYIGLMKHNTGVMAEAMGGGRSQPE